MLNVDYEHTLCGCGLPRRNCDAAALLLHGT